MRRRDFPIAFSADYRGKATIAAFLAGERAKGDDRRKAAADHATKREAALVGVVLGVTLAVIGHILGVL